MINSGAGWGDYKDSLIREKISDLGFKDLREVGLVEKAFQGEGNAR